MIRPQTILNVADNSGAKKLILCFVFWYSKQEDANIGDIIIAVVKQLTPNMPLKSDKVRAVVCSNC
jgi:large subunit ribosomal protein L14